MVTSRGFLVIAAAVAAFGRADAFGQVDNVTTVIGTANAAGGNSFGSFVYLPATDTAYTMPFGAGAALRKVENVSGAQVVTVVADEAALTLYFRNGDPTRGVSNPTPGGLITNPAAVGTIGVNGAVWAIEGGTTRFPSPSNVVDPAATKRVYRYGLGTIPPGGDGRDIFTTLVTMADMQAAAGGTTNTSTNFNRQAAFSPNGQTIYNTDSSTAFGGVWKIDPITGATSRILNVSSSGTGAIRINSEPAVFRVGDVDRILVKGNRVATAGPSFNVGGINYIDHNGTTTTDQQTYLAADTLAAFLEVTAATEVTAMTAAGDGSLYFYESSTDRMLALDPQGRLYKLTTRPERDLALTGSTTTTPQPGASVLRLQERFITHPTAGTVPQVLYADPSPLNQVSGVTVFKPTDFDRDGDQDAADLDALEPILTPRAVAASLTNARFDLNGNGVVDFKDVKIAQTFQAFPNGDTNFDFSVNFDDLLKLAQHYGVAAGRTWVHGDFNGDDAVNFDDLLTLAQNYQAAPALGVPTAIAADWALAQSLVPEPATAGILSVVLMGLGRRRRTGR